MLIRIILEVFKKELFQSLRFDDKNQLIRVVSSLVSVSNQCKYYLFDYIQLLVK